MWDALGDVPGFGWALALLILVACVVIKREVDIVARQLRRQALKRGGSVKMSLVYYPRLTFRDGGVDILVSAFFGTKRSLEGRYHSRWWLRYEFRIAAILSLDARFAPP